MKDSPKEVVDVFSDEEDGVVGVGKKKGGVGTNNNNLNNGAGKNQQVRMLALENMTSQKLVTAHVFSCWT